MKRVRFAPSPTGSLHVGNALSAVANRAFGDWMLLRIDDTDPERNLPGGEDAILADLAWLGVEWDEGPVRQSERSARYTEAGRELGDRFDGITLLREDGSATYHLASIVDDVRSASREVRTYVAHEMARHLNTPAFVDGLAGQLHPDPASQKRLPLIMKRINEIAFVP